ncbi:putative sensory transducer protein [Syntrophobacter sp. SbD1]|nr:putative sensory transducer protein [Syntrophobacter sp. SbD1]
MKLIFQNLSVNKKLFAFTVLTSLLVLAALGTGAFYFLQIERSNLLKEDVAKTVETMLVTRGAEKTYLQFFKAEEKKEFQTQAQKVTGSFEKLKSSTAGEALKGQVSSMEAHFENYQKLFGQIDELHSRQNGLREEMIKPLRASEEALRKMQTDIETKQSDLQMQGDTLSPEEFGMLNVVTDCRDSFVELQNLQLQYLLTGDQKFIDEYKKLASGNVHTYLTALNQFVSTLFKKQSWIDATANIKDSLGKFLGFIDESQQLYQDESKSLASLNESGEKVLSEAAAISEDVRRSIGAQRDKAVKLIFGSIFSGLLVFWGLSFFMVRSITRPIRNAVRGLTAIAEQVHGASSQVADAGRQLAEGSSRQAAAIEQTSSSLEEMAAMTNQNADNASQANRLVMETKESVGQANQSMQGVTASMKEISSASEETQKIIKTIDEVAFQTNLLALNAAVEAARAGEAGAGFAVVAEEVRNLARRAAQSAKDTAVLIESTVKKVKEGAIQVERTNSEFSLVLGATSKAGDLVGEIAAGSREQSEGIGQINKAVAEMNTIIQENAANAEESSSASVELNSRAVDLNAFIGDLSGLIGGSLNGEEKEKTMGRSITRGLIGSRRGQANKAGRPQTAGDYEPEAFEGGLKEQEPEGPKAKYLHSL